MKTCIRSSIGSYSLQIAISCRNDLRQRRNVSSGFVSLLRAIAVVVALGLPAFLQAGIGVSEGLAVPSSAWPELVTIATGDPALSSSPVLGNGSHLISQTFTPAATGTLQSIYLAYSTSGSSAPGAFSVRIQQVNGGTNVQTYPAGGNLLPSSSVSFGLTSTGGAKRLLKLTFTGSDQIVLSAGTTYAIEVSSTGAAVSFYRRGSDSYSGGAVYDNRSAVNCPATRDMAAGILLQAEAPSGVALSPFGVSVDSVTKNTLSVWGPQMAAIGIKGLRGFQLFSNIRPTATTWNWVQTDKFMNDASANGLSHIGMLGLNATWINSNVFTLPLSNLSEWQIYVQGTVDHCKDRVKYWEVWNEPPNYTSGATPEEYSQVVVAAYDAAKAADPEAKIGLAAKSAHINWLDRAIVAGAADHFDFITLHPYEMLEVIGHGWEAMFMSIVPSVRKMLAARNPAKQNVPILFTEIGADVGQVNGDITVTPAIQAQDLVKCYAMSLAQGVAQIDWFEGKDGDSGPKGLIDASGNPRPAYYAMGQLIQHLGHTPQYRGWVLLNTSVNPARNYGFVFQGATNSVMAAWAPPGITDTVTFSSPVTVVNPVTSSTNTNVTSYSLTNTPVLVLGVPANLITQAQTNKSKPFPWGGDYSDATTVSIPVMGTANTELGLHQLHANRTSTSVTVYGETARDWSKHTEQKFSVDPNFLSYTTSPIQVTIVARKHAGAGDARISQVNYESTTGYKDLSEAKFDIPGDDQWYTKTWTINDPQFVGMYAYNLRFYASLNNFYVKSLTVSKVVSSDLPSPWQHVDVGTVGVSGTASYSGGTYTVQGSGGNIGSGHCVYQMAEGNCSITVRLASITNDHPAARAGVVIREELGATAKFAAVVSTPSGREFWRRPTTGGSLEVKYGPSGAPPGWLRLTRVGNEFTAYTSTDNVNWTQLGVPQTISMNDTVYIGMEENSHNNTVLGTAVFDNVTVAP
jgi:hypothetical protein